MRAVTFVSQLDHALCENIPRTCTSRVDFSPQMHFASRRDCWLRSLTGARRTYMACCWTLYVSGGKWSVQLKKHKRKGKERNSHHTLLRIAHMYHRLACQGPMAGRYSCKNQIVTNKWLQTMTSYNALSLTLAYVIDTLYTT